MRLLSLPPGTWTMRLVLLILALLGSSSASSANTETASSRLEDVVRRFSSMEVTSQESQRSIEFFNAERNGNRRCGYCADPAFLHLKEVALPIGANKTHLHLEERYIGYDSAKIVPEVDFSAFSHMCSDPIAPKYTVECSSSCFEITAYIPKNDTVEVAVMRGCTSPSFLHYTGKAKRTNYARRVNHELVVDNGTDGVMYEMHFCGANRCFSHPFEVPLPAPEIVADDWIRVNKYLFVFAASGFIAIIVLCVAFMTCCLYTWLKSKKENNNRAPRSRCESPVLFPPPMTPLKRVWPPMNSEAIYDTLHRLPVNSTFTTEPPRILSSPSPSGATEFGSFADEVKSFFSEMSGRSSVVSEQETVV